MVDYNNKELFHKKGNLNASQLAKLVDDYRLAIGLEEGKLKYETIKGHISGALKSPKSSPSKD